MKKLIFLLLLPIFLLSCSDYDSDSDADTKQCWVFETTTVTTVTPSSFASGYPKIEYSTTEQCGLTSSEADTYVSKPKTVITEFAVGYYYTTTTTMAKYKKSEYKSHN